SPAVASLFLRNSLHTKAVLFFVLPGKGLPWQRTAQRIAQLYRSAPSRAGPAHPRRPTLAFFVGRQKGIDLSSLRRWFPFSGCIGNPRFPSPAGHRVPDSSAAARSPARAVEARSQKRA